MWMIDTGTGQEYGYRADERFKMLSSFQAACGCLGAEPC
ncbi:MAG: hypothetical protein JWP47_875 [Polaromonas sp.]|nr:hypothetical protein [Polaromonas sp.]